MRLELTLPKNVEAAHVAAEIARRAARYRLISEDLDEPTRTRLEQLASPDPQIGSREDALQFYDFPGARWVSEESARFMPRARQGAAGLAGAPASSSGPRSPEQLATITRPCANCGANNRVPALPGRAVRCGRCHEQFTS
jgi:hypothetical protein